MYIVFMDFNIAFNRAIKRVKRRGGTVMLEIFDRSDTLDSVR